MPETRTKAPQSWVASTRLAAGTTASPVISRRCAQARAEYSGWPVIPVPIAVPPRLLSSSSPAPSASRSRSSRSMMPYVANSWPRVIGTASCSWVRPILSTSANPAAFSSNATASRSRDSLSSRRYPTRQTLIAVG